jgi:ribosomal protein L37E
MPEELDEAPSIVCPRCGRRSYNANDIRDGYCGACHAWTTKRLREEP